MQKFLLLLILILSASHVGYASDGDKDKTTINIAEFTREVRQIQKDAEDIFQYFQIYDLEIINDTYTNFSEKITLTKKSLKELSDSQDADLRDKFYDLYELTLDSYNKLTDLYAFSVQMENKEEQWSNQYFNLWEQTYAYRTRIDNLYVKEEKVNVHYGGMKDAKMTKVRKRKIYESCISVYDQSLAELKRLNDCDHYGRIQILEDVLPVLKSCGKLAIIDNTKELEKSLRKAEDASEKAAMILDFKPE